MATLNANKIHLCEKRKLRLVAEIVGKGGQVEGWVEAESLRPLRSETGKVEVFCPQRETARFVFYQRRVFLADVLELRASHIGNGAPTADGGSKARVSTS